jgi:hypothetical protein
MQPGIRDANRKLCKRKMLAAQHFIRATAKKNGDLMDEFRLKRSAGHFFSFHKMQTRQSQKWK